MSREPRRVDVGLDEWIATHEAHRADGYTFFDFVTAVDETDRDLPDKPAGFDLVSHLYDIGDAETPGVRGSVMTRARVPLASDDDPAHAPSLTGLWRGAAWHERETFEMFGIVFDGFDDGTGVGLRKLLLPDTFIGTPLRKSFVLTARASKEWPGIKDPGESKGDWPRAGAAKRRKVMAPGVPDDTWGPR